MSKEMEIIFGSPSEIKIRGSVIFPVKYDGEVYKCVVPSEVLNDCFRSSSDNLIEIYKDNKDRIHEVAEKLIISGEIARVPDDVDDEVHITRDSLSRF